MSLENMKSDMNELINEIKSHNDLLTSIVDVMNKAIDKSNSETAELKNQATSMNNEITLLNSNIKEKEKNITNNNSSLNDLNPKIESQKKLVSELTDTISKLEEKLKSLLSSNEISDKKLNNINKEVEDKSEAKRSLLASIDSKVEANQQRLDDEKNNLLSLTEKYIAMDFLFNKIETPEVEIMAIIVANRPISTNDIKAKAKSVLPIFVGRAITKLEADGKIVSDDSELWDLSPSIVQKL